MIAGQIDTSTTKLKRHFQGRSVQSCIVRERLLGSF